jgi:hypothetical protein
MSVVLHECLSVVVYECMRGSVERMELCVLPRPAQYPAKAAVTSAIGTERGSEERGRGGGEIIGWVLVLK